MPEDGTPASLGRADRVSFHRLVTDTATDQPDKENTMTANNTPALTALETSALRGFLTGAYSFFDMGLVEGSDSRSDIFIDEMSAAIDRPTKSARGVFSSLVKKGLFLAGPADDDRDGASPVTLTALGVGTIESLILAHATDPLDHTLPLIEAETAPTDELPEDAVIVHIADEPEAPKTPTPVKEPRRTTTHADCAHAKAGREGKKARAACRRERTEAARHAATIAKASA